MLSIRHTKKGRCHVILADVDTIGANGQGHVKTIVDEQRHLARPEQRDQGPGQVDKFPSRSRFFTQLDHRDATGHGGSHHVEEVAAMPSGSIFLNQTLWGAIGWATPAAFGVALAHPERRIVLVTGEGSHQMTVQEISQFDRFGLKPIIFCLNNQGYLIERLLCKDPRISYNDLPAWNYTQLPQALGLKNWFTARVTTNGELDAAMALLTWPASVEGGSSRKARKRCSTLTYSSFKCLAKS